MSEKEATVIVVGAGPVGLVAAHALHRAGVDFVVLERRDSVMEDIGASLVLDAGSLRVLSQFGLLEKLNELSVEVEGFRVLTRDGIMLRYGTAVQILRECLGTTPRIFHRADLVRVLYEELPPSARERVLTGKHVEKMTQTSEAATIICADGTKVSGRMVIGADGVNSRVRHEMKAGIVGQANPALGYKSTYRCLWDAFLLPKDVQPGQATITQHKDQSILFLAGKQKGWLFLFEKLSEPTTDHVRYSREDVDSFAARFADWPISQTHKVRDVYDKTSAGMSNLGEGLVEDPSSGRAVLVGDACHKFTPNSGLGLNSGIQDVVALCNELHAATQGSTHESLTATQLKGMFDKYRDQRFPLIKADLSRSALQTRTDALANVWYFVLARYIFMSNFVEWLFVRYLAAPKARQALVLAYIEGEEPFGGTLSWAHPMKPVTK